MNVRQRRSDVKRTNEVYLPMNGLNHCSLRSLANKLPNKLVEAEAHQRWPPKI